MVDFYTEMQGVASEVLGEFKQGKVAYVKITPGLGPVDNPGPSTATPYELKAAARGVKFSYVQMGLAIQTDLQVTAAVDARFTPHERDFIDIDNVRHKIVKIIQKPAAGVPVAFTYIIRK